MRLKYISSGRGWIPDASLPFLIIVTFAGESPAHALNMAFTGGMEAEKIGLLAM